MYMNRQVSIKDELNDRLKEEPNASALINALLEEHYNGTDEVHREIYKTRQKTKELLQRITEINRNQVTSFNRLASAVEGLERAAREHQGYAG